MGRDFTLESLKQEGYEAVFIGIGAPQNLSMGLSGEEADGVVQAVPFLKEYNIRGSVAVGRHVVVIGGGNAAIDAARTAIRLGAESVKIIYRRSQDSMPAYEEEIQDAMEEGVELHCLVQPLEFLKDKSGSVTAVKCLPMSLGGFDRSGRRAPTDAGYTPLIIDTDQVIIAIGQRLDANAVFKGRSPVLNPKGFIQADPVNG